MTTYPVNSAPRLLAASGITSATITLVAIPPSLNNQFGAYAGAVPGNVPPTNLTLNDCTSIDGVSSDNQIGSFPFASLLTLGVGGQIQVASTTSGLVVSSLPPSCAVNIAID